MSRKVIIVGQEVLHDFFKQNYEHWDVQVVCESIDALWENLGAGTLSSNSEIVIFVDELYEENPTAFAEAVATLAPEALVMILSYTEGLEEYITHGVSEINAVTPCTPCNNTSSAILNASNIVVLLSAI